MQVTMGANCWNGQRRKSLSEIVKVYPQMEKSPAFQLDSTLKAIVSFLGFTGIPLTVLAAMSPKAFAASTNQEAIAVFASAPDAIPAMSTGLRDKILHAFDPLIDLIQSLSYPVAGVMIAGGCLFIMVGNREKGMQMLQNAAIGYILVQLSPMLLKLLVGVGESV